MKRLHDYPSLGPPLSLMMLLMHWEHQTPLASGADISECCCESSPMHSTARVDTKPVQDQSCIFQDADCATESRRRYCIAQQFRWARQCSLHQGLDLHDLSTKMIPRSNNDVMFWRLQSLVYLQVCIECNTYCQIISMFTQMYASTN